MKVSSLRGKVVLITGASSGIGAGTAVLFAALGARLALNGRDVEKLSETAQKCYEASKGKPLMVPGELTDEAIVDKVIKDTVAHYGQLDVLVNSAGILSVGTIETTSLQDFDKMMNINVRSVFHLMHLVVPHIIRTKGNIINISGITGKRSFPGFIAYCMSKSAIDQLTQCTALEMKPVSERMTKMFIPCRKGSYANMVQNPLINRIPQQHNLQELASKQVRVNAVCPGVIITDIHKRAGFNEEQYAKFLEHSKEIHPLGRVGTVEEVAQTIAFLASDAASFITGVTLSVDGGWHATCAC